MSRVTLSRIPDEVGGGPHVIAQLRGVPPPAAPGTVRVGVAAIPHDPHSPLSGLKSTSYLTHYLLREAAENETDPELREKLWDEYRRYKKGAG